MSTEEKAKLSMVNQDSLSEIQQNDALQIENEDVYEKLTFVVDKGQEPMRIDKWVQMRIVGLTRSKGLQVRKQMRRRPNIVLCW